MIEIVDYRESWQQEFEQVAATLEGGLGDLALRIDHIGSTSVPGLPAKDIIDVQVSVASFEQEDLRAAFEGLGFIPRPDISTDHKPPGVTGSDSHWEKRYFREPAGKRRMNIHVRVAGRANQRYALLFRDYLRQHPIAATAYARVKRRLAHYYPDDREAYVTIKDPVCDLIIHAAEVWAASTGWQVD